MADLAGALVSIAVFFAIVYAFVKATLAPIHEKLDRILALQQPALRPETVESPIDAGSS